MKNMKVKTKLITGFGVAIVTMAMVVAISVITNISIITNIEGSNKIIEIRSKISNVRQTYNLACIPLAKFMSANNQADYKTGLDEKSKIDEQIKDVYAFMATNSDSKQFEPSIKEVESNVNLYYERVDLLNSAYSKVNQEKINSDTIGKEVLEIMSETVSYAENSKNVSLMHTISLFLEEIPVLQIMFYNQQLNFNSDTFDSEFIVYIESLISKVESAKSIQIDAKAKQYLEQISICLQKNIEAANNWRSAMFEKNNIAATMQTTMNTTLDNFDAVVADIAVFSNDKLEKCYDIAWQSLITLSVIGIISVIITILMGALIQKAIVPEMEWINSLIEKFALGNLEFSPEFIAKNQAKAKGKDEFARSCAALDRMGLQLLELRGNMISISNGDLTVDAKTASKDDIIGTSMQKMIKQLNKMFLDIDNTSIQVSEGARQISDGAQNLAQGSTEQAASIEQLSASVSEIGSKTQENSEMANEAADLAVIIKNNTNVGKKQMEEMNLAVDEINKASTDISKVIKVIDDIAFQTNILALNAAVEAARAGEAGKGFAVVADEVRNLASKSAAAAKETNQLIENSVKKAELGAKIALETASSLEEIAEGINKSTELVANIARSSDEQRQAISQISVGIGEVSQVVQRNSATAQQAAASAQQLNAQADIMANNVNKFKLIR